MKRYIIETDHPNTTMVEDPNGRWVWYAEAQEEIDRLEAQIKESKAILQRWADAARQE